MARSRALGTLRFKETIAQNEAQTPFTESWFASGQRLGYDPRTRTMDPASPLKVWVRVDGDPRHAVTFLPGYPDGSKRGLTIVRLPGGHLTTNERPEALAHLLGDFTAIIPDRRTLLPHAGNGS